MKRRTVEIALDIELQKAGVWISPGGDVISGHSLNVEDVQQEPVDLYMESKEDQLYDVIGFAAVR